MCCVLGYFLMFPVAGRSRMAPVLAAERWVMTYVETWLCWHWVPLGLVCQHKLSSSVLLAQGAVPCIPEPAGVRGSLGDETYFLFMRGMGKGLPVLWEHCDGLTFLLNDWAWHIQERLQRAQQPKHSNERLCVSCALLAQLLQGVRAPCAQGDIPSLPPPHSSTRSLVDLSGKRQDSVRE